MCDLSTRISNSTQSPSLQYDDNVLFGRRQEIIKALERNKSGNDSGCVIHAIGAFADKKKWFLKDLVGSDRRLKSMFAGLHISHPLPLQAYCWPKLNYSTFPTICISPEATGKTFSFLLYAISKCISATPVGKTDQMIACENSFNFALNDSTNHEDLVTHPKYIIISSSHHQAELIIRSAEKMKIKAYGVEAIGSCCQMLPPIVRTVSVHHDHKKLAFRCSESDLLISTPSALLNCLKSGFLNFSRCRMVFFDDLDVSLQLHNYNIREIIKFYIIEEQQTNGAANTSNVFCQFHLFSRKWTELVKQFIASVFPQRILIFGSIAEAAVFANIKFELECYEDDMSRINRLNLLIKTFSSRDRIAIVCGTDDEAKLVSQNLRDLGHTVKLFVMKQEEQNHEAFEPRFTYKAKPPVTSINVITDEAVEIEVECLMSKNPLNNMTHIIHFSFPNDIVLFDQRFKLMYKSIQETEKSLLTTLLIGPGFNSVRAKQLFDLLCRSNSTLMSTKLLLRDRLSSMSEAICWRWASTGICRLEKLSRNDRFGSYCPDRHSVNQDGQSRWPKTGQIKLTITHIISPNEFYFWFEAHRDLDCSSWTKFQFTGVKFVEQIQNRLNRFKDAKECSVQLKKIRKGKVFGVYFHQEARVDRVVLLDEPEQEDADNVPTANKPKAGLPNINIELEYSKQVPVFKIDYGSRLEVFLKNLIELPDSLASIEPQCHRAFHLGVRPTDNEPDWLYRSKKAFLDSVSVMSPHTITAWLRLNSDNCFWLEHLAVSTRLLNISSTDCLIHEPHQDLVSAGLAETINSEPPCLNPSMRIEALSKWHSDSLGAHANYAFLRRDKSDLSIFVLDVKPDFTLIVRQSEFNKQLIQLEDDIKMEYLHGKLKLQRYLREEVYCIVKLSDHLDTVTNERIVVLNRAQIRRIIGLGGDLERPDNETMTKYLVTCLDHGDESLVEKGQIYQITVGQLRQLPFQAIHCKLANISQKLVEDKELNYRTRELIFDKTRYENNEMKRTLCRFAESGELYVEVPTEDMKSFISLSSVLDKHHDIRLHEIDDETH